MDALLKMFNAVEISPSQGKLRRRRYTNSKFNNRKVLKYCASMGFVLSPEVTEGLSEDKAMELAAMVRLSIAISPEEMNSSFHKSWDKVANTPIFLLVLEQCLHYLTTYGFEELGIYKSETVFIPDEKLNAPKFKGGISLRVIHGLTPEEIKIKLLSLLQTGIALKEETVNNIVSLALLYPLTTEQIGGIKNHEVRIVLWRRLELVPNGAMDFLRMVIYEASGKTLIIKSNSALQLIRESIKIKDIEKLFQLYIKAYGYIPLAEIFNRFKPIFLTLKKSRKLSKIINLISKLSKKHHKPLPEDFLNSITKRIKRGLPIDLKIFRNELESASPFRKIRLAYALNYRWGAKSRDPIMYKIRNGKAFSTKFSFPASVSWGNIYIEVIKSIVSDLRRNVEGHTIYIPDGISYALPATEKQFTGNFPSGSSVNMLGGLVAGIHWKNIGSHRVDLDLSLVNLDGKIGWDGAYRDHSNYFSGDVTDAPEPRGASELFYVEPDNTYKSFLLFVNFFNSGYLHVEDKEGLKAPFKLFIGGGEGLLKRKNYMIDPNNVKIMTECIVEKEKLLGIINCKKNNSCSFTFCETAIGSGRSAYCERPGVEDSFNYLIQFYSAPINLNELLLRAGAVFSSTPEEAEINLSPERLERDSIINLLRR